MNHASDNGADAYTREETYAATRRPVDLAETLLPDAYTSDEFFALERERVFAAGWVAVGCIGELREPGRRAWWPRSPAGRSSSCATGTAGCAPSTTSAATAARGC